MNVLVINCGSSSLKFQLINAESEEVLAKGICERIGIDGRLTYQPEGGEKEKSDKPMPTHTEAIQFVIEALTNPETGVVKSLDEIGAVGHRVVHGSEKFSSSVIINDEVKKAIEECNELAPLHNPANLIGVDACEKLMPGTPMVAVFDTAFHQTMPEKAYLYGLPYEYYEKYGVRRYGFHGTSHKYIAKATAAFLGKPLSELNSITMHLGNGSSMSAVQNGKCIDTSMGLTPLEGLMMGTRCGSIDPAIVPFMMEKKGMTPQEADTVLNKQSGLLGICGTSDMRDVHANIEKGDEKAALAFKMLTAASRKCSAPTSSCSATLTPSCSPPVSAKTMNSSAKPSAKALSPSASRWTKRKTIPVSPGPASSAHLTAASPSSSFPPMKNWRSLRPRCASWKKARSKVFS